MNLCNGVARLWRRNLTLSSKRFLSDKLPQDGIDITNEQLEVPPYPDRINEPIEAKKARLIYQTRRRGILENDLLLSTFLSKYMKELDNEKWDQYDRLINKTGNEWDIYYWASGTKPVPPEHDTAIMRLLKEHAKNSLNEKRLRMPDLVN